MDWLSYSGTYRKLSINISANSSLIGVNLPVQARTNNARPFPVPVRIAPSFQHFDCQGVIEFMENVSLIANNEPPDFVCVRVEEPRGNVADAAYQSPVEFSWIGRS